MVHWDDEPLMWDDPQGLVHIGGDLEPESLLGAYRRGIAYAIGPGYSGGRND